MLLTYFELVKPLHNEKNYLGPTKFCIIKKSTSPLYLIYRTVIDIFYYKKHFLLQKVCYREILTYIITYFEFSGRIFFVHFFQNHLKIRTNIAIENISKGKF